MLITLKERTFKKINNFVGEYKLRKIFTIIFTIAFLMLIIFPFIQIQQFLDFMNKEIDLNKRLKISNPNLIASQQETFIRVLMALTSFFGSLMFIIICVCAYFIFSNKNNGYIFFRSLTWISLIVIIFIFLALAIKPGEITIRDPSVPEDPLYPAKGLVSIGKPTYSLSWVMLFTLIITAISTGLIRKEYGYLKKDISIKKYEIFKQNQKK